MKRPTASALSQVNQLNLHETFAVDEIDGIQHHVDSTAQFMSRESSKPGSAFKRDTSRSARFSTTGNDVKTEPQLSDEDEKERPTSTKYVNYLELLSTTEKKFERPTKEKVKVNAFEHIQSRVYDPVKKETMEEALVGDTWRPVYRQNMNSYEQTVWSLVSPEQPESLFSKKQEVDGWNDDIDLLGGTAMSALPSYSQVEYNGGWPSRKQQVVETAPLERVSTTRKTVTALPLYQRRSSKAIKKKNASAPSRALQDPVPANKEDAEDENSLPCMDQLNIIEKSSPISIMRKNEREDTQPFVKLSDEWIALKSNSYAVSGSPFSTIFRKSPKKEMSREPVRPSTQKDTVLSHSWSAQRKRAQCTLRELKSVFPPIVDEKRRIYTSLSTRSGAGTSTSTSGLANHPRKHVLECSTAHTYNNPVLDRTGKILKGRPKQFEPKTEGKQYRIYSAKRVIPAGKLRHPPLPRKKTPPREIIEVIPPSTPVGVAPDQVAMKLRNLDRVAGRGTNGPQERKRAIREKAARSMILSISASLSMAVY